MSDSLSCDAGSAEERVAEVVDEFMARVGRGERPDVDEYVRQHPDLADVLRHVLPVVQMIRPDGESGPQPLEPDSRLVGGALGDFRILREVGRGGMGVVFEAEQISLGRRVALKVLPYAAALDPRQLQRFKNEARAAASLRHEHIVAIHAVGYERGTHFIAMEYIEGPTLARVIRGAHPPAVVAAKPDAAAVDDTPASTEGGPPTPPVAGLSTEGGKRDREFHRAAARLIAEAAEALEYSHSMGVVHRDVKPGNLLIDAAGKLWVTDFGLARFDAGTSLTASGDLIGTLRYMAPEQALAKHGLVDHRADVYALGATLYELLTGRPAVDGVDRQEILRKIAFEEPASRPTWKRWC
jgi:hypothetical protein